MSSSETPVRLSMWSGPRNISTAMMRSFGSRPDCLPVDEPFYSYYLTETGLQHPMRDEVIASQPQDWQTVIEALETPLPSGKSVLYIKHMAQHMLADIKLDRLQHHRHCFLIRDPRLVIASFSEKWGDITADATGIRRQVELYRYFCETSSSKPVIIEGEDIQRNPEGMLRQLCDACGIAFSPSMLSWTAGAHPEDGIWGQHWYNAVEKSTGFAPYSEKKVFLDAGQQAIADELMPYYEELRSNRLTL